MNQPLESKTKNAAKSSPSSYHHSDLAQTLIQAGLDILKKKGADGLSLRAVAARAGVSEAAPYSHFKNKKDLLFAISASGFRELANAMISRVPKDTDPHTALQNYGIAYIDFAVANPDLYRQMIAAIDPNVRRSNKTDIGPGRKLLYTEADRAQNVLKKANEAICTDKEEVRMRTLSAWGVVHGLASLIVLNFIQIPKKGRTAFLRELLSATTKLPSN